MEVAALGLRIDGVGNIDQATSSLGRFTQSADSAEKSASALDPASRKSSQSVQQLGKSSDSTSSSLNSLGSTATKIGGILAAAFSAQKAYQAMEAYTSIANRMRLVTSSAEEMAAAQEAVFRIAQSGRQPLSETAELYQRIASNQSELGLTGAGVARVTDTISKSLAVSGTSAASAAGALTQLGQAFASGTLRGEELNSVLENTPALAQAIAKGMGVTVGQLRALGAEGSLTAQAVVDALISQSEAMDESFGKIAPTISSATTTVGNALTQMIGKMDQAGGTSGKLAESIIDIADILSDPATVNAAESLGSGVATALGWIVTAASNTVSAVKWMAESLAATFGGIAADDIVRLEDELARLQDMRESGPLDRLVFFGRDGVASYYNDEEIDAEIAKIQAAIKAYNDLAKAGDKIGSGAEITAPKLEKFRTSIERSGYAAAESSSATTKQANAFQSLMDSLYPAEAAQRKHNEQIALLSKYLSGNQLADAVSRLNKSIAGADANGPADAIEAYRGELEKLQDRIDPIRKATREYEKDIARLREGLDRGEISIERHAELMSKLEKEYAEASGAASEWGQFTERALDSVDQAFADAWKNIDQGFSGFADGLKNAFKNLLAELAHMAITRPIVMQIGVALGVGGMAGQSSGLWGMPGGGSSGGVGGMMSNASSLYSMYQASQGEGLLGSVFGGFKSGGVGGAFNGATIYFGNALGGIDQSLGQIYGVLTNGSGMSYAPLSYQAGVNGWGNMAATAAPWLAGGLGALMGYQNAGVKGAAAGAAGAAGGYYAGSALGSLVGPLGTVVGGAIGSALGGVLGGSLFGGKWQTKDVGIALGIESGALSAQEYKYQKKKGGLFGSNKKRTRYYDLDQETAAALGDAYAATADSVFDLFESLSYTIEDNALAGLNMAKTKISTKGKTEEEIQQAIADWFGTAADAMTAELHSVFGTGLDLDFAGMQQFVGNLKGVNEVIRYLNVGMFDMTVAGGKLAEQLSGIAGGLDALAVNAATYYDAFFTEAEKIENTIDSIERAFEAADTELASSREAYRAMVEDIDITTEAGQEMFATLMALSGQAAAYYDILEARAAQALANEQTRLAQGFNDSAAIAQAAFGALQAAIGREASKIQASMLKTNANIGELTQLSNSLASAIRSMRMDTQEFDRMARERAQDQLSSALSTARSGGSLLGVDLSGTLSELGRSSADLFTSFEDYARDYWRTANDINELNKLTGTQLTNEEQSLANQQAQLEKYDLMLADAQNQLNALYGINTSVLSVAAALAGFQSALKSAQAAPKSNQQIVEAAYQSVLHREGEAGGVAFWTDRLNSGVTSAANLEAEMAKYASQRDKDRLKAMGVPGFANGGAFTNGIVQRPTAFNMAVMGEAGAEGILPLANVGGRLGVHANVSKGDSAEVTMLRQELSAMREILLDMRVNAKITADSVQNMNESGVIIDNS